MQVWRGDFNPTRPAVNLSSPPLCRAHTQYCSGGLTEEEYGVEMEAVTGAFARLSRELLSLVSWFHDNGQSESSAILREIQLREKEKLTLVSTPVISYL